MKATHTQFAGAIPANYDRYMGPLFFEPYAIDLAQRVQATHATNILEIACGTGRVTNHLVAQLPPGAMVTATDLNSDMIAIAKQQLHHSNLQFLEADAQHLPFDDACFDAAVCQFGFMFVPDKQQAFDEVYRVLQPGGTLLFNTWDRLENNVLPYIVQKTVATHIDGEAAKFYDVPFSMHDPSPIATLLQQAGFSNIQHEIVTKTGIGSSAEDAAKGLLLGTPAYKVISEKKAGAAEELVAIAANNIAAVFGKGQIQTTLNAWVFKATK